MKIISLKYLEENFDEVLELAQAGESFLLDTPDGQIALVPDKTILKPNNLNYPNSRLLFINSLK